ncbi:MAG: hypothetical protein AAGA12_13590 [Pseudomonadota bacterium]
MIKAFKNKFPVDRLDSKMSHQGLTISERRDSWMSRNRAVQIICAIGLSVFAAGIALVPDWVIGSTDAVLIRLLTLPAIVLLGLRCITAIWHDWRNIVQIDRVKQVIRHVNINRRGLSSGILAIPFDDLISVTLSVTADEEEMDPNRRVSLVLRYRGVPGRLVLLQGTVEELTVARDLIIKDVQTYLKPHAEMKPEETLPDVFRRIIQKIAPSSGRTLP